MFAFLFPIYNPLQSGSPTVAFTPAAPTQVHMPPPLSVFHRQEQTAYQWRTFCYARLLYTDHSRWLPHSRAIPSEDACSTVPCARIRIHKTCPTPTTSLGWGVRSQAVTELSRSNVDSLQWVCRTSYVLAFLLEDHRCWRRIQLWRSHIRWLLYITVM